MARPRKIKDIDYTEIEKLAGLGLTDVEISYMLNICEATLNNYKKDAKFLESLKKGKVIADSKVIISLYRKALGGDTTACIFWLKNRRPQDWREKQDTDINMNGASQTMKDLLESLSL